jgi:hypothetical protein
MDAPVPTTDPPAPPDRRAARIWLGRAGLIVGIGLVVAAVGMVWSSRDQVAQALGEVRNPSPLHVAILLASVIVNIALSGLLFSVLMAKYGTVRLLEMQALIASSALLNYLPLRPGFFGRVAYHKAVNRIAAIDAAKAVVQAAICTGIIAAYLALALATCRTLDAPLIIAALLPAPLVAIGALVGPWRRWSLALGIRSVEIAVWALRYWAAFGLLGIAIDAETSMALACIGVIATMVPLLSNGLGLREWAIGLASPWLTANVASLQLGLAADLVNRAAELVVVTIAGLAGIAYLARRRR